MNEPSCFKGRWPRAHLPRGQNIPDLSAVEFRVFSQWGEDEIIEWLAAHVPVSNTRFVEFGVETFREANCRFLLLNRNWKGLVMDGSAENMAALKDSALYWMYDLTGKAAFYHARKHKWSDRGSRVRWTSRPVVNRYRRQ